MKKMAVITAVIGICMNLTACGGRTEASVGVIGKTEPEVKTAGAETSRPFFNSRTSEFNTLTGDTGEGVSAEFDVFLSETEAGFLFIEVSEDTEATLRYTYSTGDEGGVKMGYYETESGKRTEDELPAATDDAYGVLWTEEKITLKKGTNEVYLAGENKTVKMRCEIGGLDESKVLYKGVFPKEAAPEELTEKN